MAYALVVVAGAVALGVVFAAAFLFQVAGTASLALACGSCAVLAAVAANRWPAPSWTWGLWASAPFWAFFLIVFLALAVNGEPDASPMIDAILVIGSAAAAAAFGSRARRSDPPGP